MGEFEVIASSGHCGTKWLAQVLDAGTDSKWYHELRLQTCGSWVEAMQHKVDGEFFNEYWLTIGVDIFKLGKVGDSNSWPPFRLPEVNERRKIDRVIYLTRNPVLQLHSLAYYSYVWHRPEQDWPAGARRYLIDMMKAGGYKPPPSRLSRWEKLCILVAANDFMPGWLWKQGFNVSVYTLEELTTQVSVLMGLAPKLTPDEARAWQQRDINRKVSGERNPDAIWASWTDEQREAFNRIVLEHDCGTRPHEMA